MCFQSHRCIVSRWFRRTWMCFQSHRDISRWFRRTWMCFWSHQDISRCFWFSFRRFHKWRWDCKVRRRGHYWLGVNAALIFIIANCVNSMNSSASQISSSIWPSLMTARMSSSKFRIVSSFSCSRSFCCHNLVIIMADGWSCSSRVSKISSTDKMIFLVDVLWPVQTFRFLTSFPGMKIDAINPSKDSNQNIKGLALILFNSVSRRSLIVIRFHPTRWTM